MDLASFKTVNAKVTTESKKDSYDIRIVPDEASIIFTAHAFKALDLDNNSLDERDNGEVIALVTRPGNDGTFMRRIANAKNKGKKTKNERLIADLREKGIEGNYLKLEFAGEQNGERFYIVSQFTGEVPTAPERQEAEEVASEEAGAAEGTADAAVTAAE